MHPHGVVHRVSASGGAVHEGVEVRQQGVAHLQSGYARLRHALPAVQLLRHLVDGVVVAHEGREGAHLNPARTQLLRGVPVEAADVGPSHGQAEQGEVIHRDDRPAQVIPRGCIVPRPVSGVLPRTQECGAGENKGALVVADFEQGSACGDAFHHAVQIVRIVLQHTTCMQRRHRDGLAAEFGHQ